MNLLLSLRASKEIKLNIYIPNQENKINWYYEATEQLHEFDEVTVVYISKNEKMLLSKDIAKEILIGLSSLLRKALDEKLTLPNNINKNELGNEWNKDTYFLSRDENLIQKNQEDVFSKYWLFSDNNVQTWIYNVEDKICLEISPSYEWFYKDPRKSAEFISFENFIKNYKSHAFFCIDIKTAEKWKNDCDQLLKKLGYML